MPVRFSLSNSVRTHMTLTFKRSVLFKLFANFNIGHFFKFILDLVTVAVTAQINLK